MSVVVCWCMRAFTRDLDCQREINGEFYNAPRQRNEGAEVNGRQSPNTSLKRTTASVARGTRALRSRARRLALR